ncbi:hypothetical protein MKZ38_006808 [Zalerion maritima]|uniref:Uncharacterized protein n=1 Tax=Zalerion maritima TaxID=339359 RepID=A0AAD5WTV9_9PEZI|nr:hypothetical protein MKZ38_006808 [Zalerion maritima]
MMLSGNSPLKQVAMEANKSSAGSAGSAGSADPLKKTSSFTGSKASNEATGTTAGRKPDISSPGRIGTPGKSACHDPITNLSMKASPGSPVPFLSSPFNAAPLSPDLTQQCAGTCKRFLPISAFLRKPVSLDTDSPRPSPTGIIKMDKCELCHSARANWIKKTQRKSGGNTFVQKIVDAYDRETGREMGLETDFEKTIDKKVEKVKWRGEGNPTGMYAKPKRKNVFGDGENEKEGEFEEEEAKKQKREA